MWFQWEKLQLLENSEFVLKNILVKIIEITNISYLLKKLYKNFYLKIISKIKVNQWIY